MDEYKFFKKNVFESLDKFERRLNEMCQQGWKPISIASDQGTTIILLQKTEKYNY